MQHAYSLILYKEVCNVKFKYLAIRDSISSCLRVTLSILGTRPILMSLNSEVVLR